MPARAREVVGWRIAPVLLCGLLGMAERAMNVAGGSAPACSFRNASLRVLC